MLDGAWRGWINFFLKNEISWDILDRDLNDFVNSLVEKRIISDGVGTKQDKKLLIAVFKVVRHTWELEGADGKMKTGSDLQKVIHGKFPEKESPSVADLYAELKSEE